MARPSKPASVLAKEGRSHFTKEQLAQREREENALATGTAFCERAEVRKNPVAHAEFIRLSRLLGSIGKNDAIYETVINRYCIILSECLAFEDKREKINTTAVKIEELVDKLDENADIDTLKKISMSLNGLYKTMIDLDKQIESKRKMLLSIEKENIMTVAAALRSVPKAPEKKENPLLKALSGDAN